MISLKTPLKKEDIQKLNVGDRVLLSGTIFTARDKACNFLLQNHLAEIENSAIYHCGPIVKGNKVISAGPTTSYRLNQYTPELIEKYGVKAIIGKGGMDESVLNALKGRAVYLSAVGGAGVIYATATKVKNVYKKEFGMPEAIWELEVKDFPAIVTMDSKGNNLYAKVFQKSKKAFVKLILPTK
ncbi:MAG: FumA C-terminus/TtdB family hydratase beta subunit [archaeon]|jgi:fumarate hydratase subunit beta|nr:FumA C-terminus/TtdB family hydratase beta subunit [archaeon]